VWWLVLWFRSGRHEPKGRTGWTLSALVYRSFLPVLLMGLLPRCFVARSYALNRLDFPQLGSQRPKTTPKPDSRGLPFTAVTGRLF